LTGISLVFTINAGAGDDKLIAGQPSIAAFMQQPFITRRLKSSADHPAMGFA